MSRVFHMMQLNVRKQGEIHDSLMNDEKVPDMPVLAIQEPHARRIRSMLWINIEVEAEQVRIESPDMTAAVVRLPDRLILVVADYVPGRRAGSSSDM
ncbi:uncharacterized protein PV06_11780 [Exophiala oligosperma]|uniref:Uncharacterized protein n=1 Tax=Exophiala oligosperma TaxID=215243 RepID=A0A0D2CXV8_9EURO|nr:uncharacterized protein PV06_11780 [Exophiala oligosperma]KIW35908.1 hypothetical protein PV06_11780 [Exophiala oligosperma]